jgi:hypothetical protein
MFRHIRGPSPSVTLALLALFVALGGTAVAANVVPLAKRALVADNAKKVGGLTARRTRGKGCCHRLASTVSPAPSRQRARGLRASPAAW